MDINDAVQTLKKHNAWRRHDGDIRESPKMIDGIQIGIAIDTVIKAIENYTQYKIDK